MRAHSLALWLAAAVFTAGCGGSSSGSQEWAGQCSRDTSLVAAVLARTTNQVATTCGRDSDCPCGTGCNLGRCEAACTWNADCGEGKVCNSYGQCQAPDVPATKVVDGSARGSLLVDRTQADLFQATDVERFRITARLRAVDPIRVIAEAGLEVSCGEAFADSCTFGPLAPEELPREVQVRSAGAFPSDDRRLSVIVRSDQEQFTVGVLQHGAPAEPQPGRDGVYEGKAWLLGAGLRARTTQDALPDDLARLALPVTAKVYPAVSGQYVVELKDERNTVFAAGTVGVLSLTPGTSTWQLDLPSRQYLGDDVDVPAATELDVHVTGQVRQATFSNGLLFGELVSTFEGIAPVAQAPFVRWRISLIRTGALPEGSVAPAVEPRPVADVQARANVAFAEEGLATTNLTGLSAQPLPDKAVATLCSTGALKTTLLATTNAYGDLLCAGSGPQLAFGPEAGKLQDRGVFLDDCVGALNLGATPAWDAVAGPTDCASRARAVASVAFALEIDRGRAFGSATAANLPSSRLATRVLQQWMGVQSLAALEPRRIFRVGPLLPSGTALDRLRFYSQPEQVFAAVQQSISAWDLVLHPRIGSAITAMSPQALNASDYRPDFASGTYPQGEQSSALPVTLLATLTQQLNGLTGVIDDLTHFRTGTQDPAAVQGELARFLPRNVVLFAMAQGLHDAARSVSAPTWEPLWANARVLYGAAAAKLVDQIRLLESGANPLGITAEDLPLYRLGDQQGTTRRFSAMSDSLLGREDLLDPAIAPTLIDRAREAELLARDSVTALLNRDLQTDLQASETDRRLEAIKRYYGDQITSMCNQFESLTVLDNPDQVDPDTCFIAPQCSFSTDQYNSRLSTADLGYQICLAAKLRERFGDAISTGQAELDKQLSQIGSTFSASTPFFSADFGTALIDGFSAGYEGVTPPNITLPAGVDMAAVREVEALCDSARAATEGARPTALPSTCANTDACPVGYVCDPTSTCVPEEKQTDPSCYIGSLGEAALAVESASTEVDIARSEMEEFSERYDNAMRGCIILEQGADAIEAAMTAHNNTMTELANAKFAADTAAKVAEKAANLFSVDKVWQAVGTAAFGAVQQAAESTADTLQLRMDQVEREHELTLTKLQNDTDQRLCLNEAESELVGTRSAALRVQRQSQELTQTIVQFNNLKISLIAGLADGTTSLNAERMRHIAPANVDHWLDQNLDLYEQRLRRARRALYLAVQAVEYEFQFSSQERSAVLAAQTPEELEGILGRLRDTVRRGAPEGGGNPTQLLTVVSLRKNLLQVAGREALPASWHQVTEVERFRELLLSPRFAAYDESGRYVGQEIPFSLQPVGAGNLADPGGIPLLSGLSCAERLWSVNASVRGLGLIQGSDTTIVTLQLRKRNTFSSQWCGGTHDGLAQVASTRPSQNLFVDPYSASTWRNDDVVAQLTNTQEVASFSYATVQARTNVDQGTLEQTAYVDGQSTALAGRGAFGDYTLFIPATTQSIGGGIGLRLDHVDDVLIRLDYVAAERR